MQQLCLCPPTIPPLTPPPSPPPPPSPVELISRCMRCTVFGVCLCQSDFFFVLATSVSVSWPFLFWLRRPALSSFMASRFLDLTDRLSHRPGNRFTPCFIQGRAVPRLSSGVTLAGRLAPFLLSSVSVLYFICLPAPVFGRERRMRRGAGAPGPVTHSVPMK